MNALDFTLLEQIPASSNFSLLGSLFIDLKNIAPNYYKQGKFHSLYEEYMRKLLDYRLKMTTEYICDVTVSNKSYPEDDILNFIVFKLYEYILRAFEYRYQSINEVDMANNCIACCYKVLEICASLKIPCEKVEIYPGYNDKARLFGLCGYHYFNIVTINNKKYLIDGSYKQFFKKSHSSLEEIGVPLTCAPLPGIFMQQTKTRQQVAKKLLKDGWIELTEDTLKSYCDGFTLSFRNGLYYETHPKDFTTSYTAEDYLNFLSEKDNQTNHEQLEHLGPLRKVLKQPLNFSRK